MKAKVDIYTGFLSSGKTSMLKHDLKRHLGAGEKIVVLQCEAGEEGLDEAVLTNYGVRVIKLAKDEALNADMMQRVVSEYTPDRIIIEQNGFTSLTDLLNMLTDKNVRARCVVNHVTNIIDSRNYDMLLKAVGSNLVEQTANSDIVVMNFADAVSVDKLKNLRNTIKSFNKSCEIINVGTPQSYALSQDVAKTTETKTSAPIKTAIGGIRLFVLFAALFIFYKAFSTAGINASQIGVSELQILNTVFISILMQAFPFLLMGVLVSSIIQVFVSRDMIVRFFPKNKLTSMIVAILGGLFFPVCDCAIIPVVSRLVKKGVPLYAAITFMLAAPIVNPIVIASTIYAFPGEPMVVFFRVVLGVIIAMATGFAFIAYPEKEKMLLLGNENIMCACAYCSSPDQAKGIIGKLSAVFKHAGEEFFDVGRFLVIGSLLTSVFQVFISKEALGQIGGSNVISLIVMMAAAFILSVCSSSDAFIARSFTTQFSIGSVMGFLVLGPMLDIKNMLMLLGGFKARFVAKLFITVSIIAFAVLYMAMIMIF